MFRFDLDSEELAAAYGRASALLFTSGKKLVQALHPVPGQRVLDVGCGTGLLADYVSRIVAPDGIVVGIDPLPLRVAIALRRQRPNLTFQVGTADDLSPFPAGSFDAAYLHFVFHWLPDRVEPLRQLQRVLKTGSRLGLTAPSRERGSVFEETCDEVLSRPPYDTYPAAREARGHRVSRDELAELFDQTGFSVTEMESEVTASEWPTAEEAIAFSETITAGNLFGHLPPELREPARRDVAAAVERRRDGGVIRLGGARISAVATRR